MSRHYIVLPAKIDAQIDGQARKLTSATIICGFDKFPTRHFFCNVSESLIPEHVDEPIWASVLTLTLIMLRLLMGLIASSPLWASPFPHLIKMRCLATGPRGA